MHRNLKIELVSDCDEPEEKTKIVKKKQHLKSNFNSLNERNKKLN